MKNQRLNTKKKKGTKIWITLAVLFTILIGASLGALSAYNWSVENAIQGLFYNSTNQQKDTAKEQQEENNQVNESDSGNDNAEEEELPAQKPPEPSDDELKDETPPVKEEEPLTPATVKEPTYVDGIMIANKEYPLPEDFAPGENAEAKAAFNEMEKAAALEGFELVAFSTYRSYEYQDELYHRYVEEHGQEEADRFSAKPGYSEHQTGLGFDIGEIGQEAKWADDSFKDTEAAEWLADNAHHFGFILRYPPGKEEITGYQYESWHFRYLGEDLAAKVHNSGLTLEEYLNL